MQSHGRHQTRREEKLNRTWILSATSHRYFLSSSVNNYSYSLLLQASLYPQCWTVFPQHWTASGPIERNSKPRLPSVALFSPIYLYICYFYSLARVTPILSYNCSHLPPRSQKINHFLSLFLHFFLALCFLLFLLPPSFPLSSLPPNLSSFTALRYNS